MTTIDDIRKNWKQEIKITNPDNYAIEVFVEEGGVIIRAFDSDFHHRIREIVKGVGNQVIDGSNVSTR